MKNSKTYRQLWKNTKISIVNNKNKGVENFSDDEFSTLKVLISPF